MESFFLTLEANTFVLNAGLLFTDIQTDEVMFFTPESLTAV
jgi:hypothetical protein